MSLDLEVDRPGRLETVDVCACDTGVVFALISQEIHAFILVVVVVLSRNAPIWNLTKYK